MTEISLPNTLDQRHRNGRANIIMKETPQTSNDSSDSTVVSAVKPKTSRAQTALFVQAANKPLEDVKVEIKQLPLEEDHTIVIDLTEERYNITRDTNSCRVQSSSRHTQSRPCTENLSPEATDTVTNGEEGLSPDMVLKLDQMRLITVEQNVVPQSGDPSLHLPSLPVCPASTSQQEEVSENCEKTSDGPNELSCNNEAKSLADSKSNFRRPRQLNLVKSMSQDKNSAANSIGELPKSSSIDEMAKNQRGKSLKRDQQQQQQQSSPPPASTSRASLNLFDPVYSSPGFHHQNGSSATFDTQTSNSSRYPSLSASAIKGTSIFNQVEDGHRSLDRRLVSRERRGRHQRRSIKSRKSQSSDFLDRLDTSISSGHDRSSTAARHRHSSMRRVKSNVKMSKIEKGLFLGNLEAATDVILLESNAISHIITIDSVPLPRKMSSFLPRIVNVHLQVSDLKDEDILSCIETAVDFIDSALHSEGNNVLVHCFRGKSRSAALVIAYLMQKYRYSVEKAWKKVKSKRECISPHDGFIGQLKLFESMDFSLDPSNLQFKMFKQHLASERMRKAKILFRDTLDNVLDQDPGENHSSKSKNYSMLFKCKRCRRTLATSHNLMPHVRSEPPVWNDAKWSLPAEEVLEGTSDLGLELCNQTVFINPIRWMQNEVKQSIWGRLFCPNCQAGVGDYSWVKGLQCASCKVTVTPAFQLDVTEIIFKTKSRFLQSSGREPVLV